MKRSRFAIQMANEAYSANIEWLLRRRRAMFDEANAACEAIWAENVERMGGPAAERLRYIVRVKERKIGITVEWLRFQSQWSHKAQKHMARYKPLARGKSFQHFPEQFKGATGAELDLIMEVERKVASLRQETEWNTKFKRVMDAHPVRVAQTCAALAEKRAAVERARRLADRDDDEQALVL